MQVSYYMKCMCTCTLAGLYLSLLYVHCEPPLVFPRSSTKDVREKKAERIVGTKITNTKSVILLGESADLLMGAMHAA